MHTHTHTHTMGGEGERKIRMYEDIYTVGLKINLNIEVLLLPFLSRLLRNYIHLPLLLHSVEI